MRIIVSTIVSVSAMAAMTDSAILVVDVVKDTGDENSSANYQE